VSVLEILAEEWDRCVTDVVGTPRTWRDEDLPARDGQTIIEIVVLITNEIFVVETDLVEDFSPKYRKARALGIAFVVGDSALRVANADRMRHRHGDRLPKAASPFAHDGATSAPDFRMFIKKLDTGVQIVLRVFGMCAHDGDVSTARLSDAAIHA